jgi:MFS family permease
MFFTILYAIVSSNYTDRLQIVIAYIEMSAGFGLIAGPSIGSVLYYVGGYFVPFLTLSIWFALAVPVICMLLGPDRPYIDRNKSLRARDLVKCLVRHTQSISLNLINCSLLLLGIGLLTPIVTLHLMSYGLTTQVAGMLSVTNTTTYLIASPIVANLSVNKRLLITIGLLLNSLAFCTIGPLSPLPNQLGVVVSGLGLSGIAFALVYSE